MPLERCLQPLFQLCDLVGAFGVLNGSRVRGLARPPRVRMHLTQCTYSLALESKLPHKSVYVSS
jgi:hypothetical protein